MNNKILKNNFINLFNTLEGIIVFLVEYSKNKNK